MAYIYPINDLDFVDRYSSIMEHMGFESHLTSHGGVLKYAPVIFWGAFRGGQLEHQQQQPLSRHISIYGIMGLPFDNQA